ncbi:MAG TPA: tripartite tricarboxylate transporter substrate binding protein [Burkholderiaceae bacterium]|nr:tripartite tricarboxylate transporter substrate binding protein [Burkholderiaceae bacterium]
MAVLAIAAPAFAQTYPARPIKLVVPQPPGSPNDTLARGVAEALTKVLTQPVIVENKPGANGALAASYVISQPADGYTLLLAGVSNMSWNPLLYKNLGHSPARDFTGVAMLAETEFITAVAPKLGVKTLAELIEKAKAEPGKISYASSGIGNSTHLSTELLMARTGIEMQHVPFSGVGASRITVSVMSGDTPVITGPVGGLLPLLQAGKVVALAVTGEQRLPALPAVPTFRELGVDLAVPGWYAVVARSTTPADVVRRLNAEINTALDTPAVKQLLTTQVLHSVKAAPSEVDLRTKRDSDAWAPLIQKLGVAH